MEKVNLGISGAKEIEEAVLASTPLAACDAVDKINNKLNNEIKVTLPTDF